ncbi:benzoate 4-monooxygenase cytochrome P450 [Apiospora kogelbergensis]|uniref:benzoate 4-monooxygenase cytochrome P450 n=1 Tax=Apiospora kogelbergensis TaxID=1337665 RepID=UPI00312D9168
MTKQADIYAGYITQSLGLSNPTMLLLLLHLVLLVVVLRRLYFAPASNFPGPFWAKVSMLYEVYHVFFRDDWYDNLISLHENYGPVVRIGPNEVHISDPEFCHNFHRRSDLRKCPEYYGLIGTALGGLAEPQDHLKRKALLQPFFTGKPPGAVLYGGDEHPIGGALHRLISEESSRSGGDTNMTLILWALTNDIMMSYIFGESPGYLAELDLADLPNATRAYGAIDFSTIARSVPLAIRLYNSFPFLRRLSFFGWIDKLIDSHISHTTKPSQAEKDDDSVFMCLLSQVDGDRKLTTHEIAQAIFIGNESLLSNLSFLLYYMIENPHCVQALRAELDTLDTRTYGHQIWRDPKVSQLPYLDALCRESTRLSPPRWHRQPRQSTEPVPFKTGVIPKGVSISFTLRMLERDETLFRNPEAFLPERWLGGGQEAQTLRQNSITFGTGTRTCLGQSFARQVLKKTLVCILYEFDVSLVDPDKDKNEGLRYLCTYPSKGKAGDMKVRVARRFIASEQ